ncbi:hypothetical protein L218DRAFT_72665 [Marasmius fiardii PR-910]|nr:hypothetical protein L218DRAFT_72665 [Marasmius fiardii PR-910]
MKAFLSVVLAALLSCALAAPAQPEEMVMTPGGLRPKSSVIQIPEGGSIKVTATEIHLLDSSNTIVHTAPKTEAKVSPASATTGAPPPLQTGWISWAQWRRTSSPIQEFVTTWTVPPNPPANNGQLLYLFNGLEPDTGTAILQPVLQWGFSPAGGGPYWAVSNWYVSDKTTYWSTLQNVTVGQSLQGVIKRTAQNADGTFNYVSEFTNIPGTATLTNSPELTWAFETLEAYSVSATSDYPKGCTVFSQIKVTTGNGAETPIWQTIDDSADSIHTTRGSNGDISVCYPSS